MNSISLKFFNKRTFMLNLQDFKGYFMQMFWKLQKLVVAPSFSFVCCWNLHMPHIWHIFDLFVVNQVFVEYINSAVSLHSGMILDCMYVIVIGRYEIIFHIPKFLAVRIASEIDAASIFSLHLCLFLCSCYSVWVWSKKLITILNGFSGSVLIERNQNNKNRKKKSME